MKTEHLLTLEHEFNVHGNHAVLAAAGGVPVHESLDAATDFLEAVSAGLRELMCEPAVSSRATLAYYAAENALALVYASHAALDPAAGGAA